MVSHSVCASLWESLGAAHSADRYLMPMPTLAAIWVSYELFKVLRYCVKPFKSFFLFLTILLYL